MTSGPTTCRQLHDFTSDLEYGIQAEKDQAHSTLNKILKSPHLLVTIGDINTWSLIDTGSQISVISLEFYNTLKNKMNLLELPVSNMTVSTAIGKKSTTIKKQVSLSFEIGSRKFAFIFVVVPFLTSQIILGNDLHLRYGTIINYQNQTVCIGGNIIPNAFTWFEKSASDRVKVSNEKGNTLVYIINFTDEYADIEDKAQTSQASSIGMDQEKDENRINENNVVINKISIRELYDIIDEKNFDKGEWYSNDDDFIDIDIDNFENVNVINSIEKTNNDTLDLSQQVVEKVNNLLTIDEHEKQIFILMLLKNIEVFSDKPGCAKDYIHEIRLTKQNPIIKKNILGSNGIKRKSQRENQSNA